ncbi:MAG: DEAD/DEAH box helicase [Verrucomicrobiota bacterium]
MSFQTLGLGPNILKALQEAGYTKPTPIQTAAIPPILEGRDLIGIAQTGTGKTAAFVLPILAKLKETAPGSSGTRALILAPTRELAAQIEENVRAYARHLRLRMAVIFGGVGERPQIEALKSGVELIIATPGRLLDLMGRGYGNFAGLHFLVLDEADRMLDMGFLPDIRRIVKALPRKRQTLLFSATLSSEIEGLTQAFLHDPQTVEIGHRANPAETVTQRLYEVPKSLKQNLLLHLMKDPGLNPVLVFSRTKHGADRIARALERNGITAAALHSNRSQNQRIRALNAFKSGEVRVLVATDIAARGIDVEGISHVINFDFPLHAEDYVHRIGRTGRAEQAGDAVSFITPEDRTPLRDVERLISRKIPRCQAAGFDLTAPAPAAEPAPRHGRPQRASTEAPHANGGGNRRNGPRSQGGSRGGSGGGKSHAKAIPGVQGVPGGRTWSPRGR